MTFSGQIDARLLPECLTEAGLSAANIGPLRAMLAQLLTGKLSSPTRFNCELTRCGNNPVTLIFELKWDSILTSIESDTDAGFSALIAKYSQTYDEAILQRAKFETGKALLALDEKLLLHDSSIMLLSQGQRQIDDRVADILLDFYLESCDRVIHEEIVRLMSKPVKLKSARLKLGAFLCEQFQVPTKRIHRFAMCQALSNLSESEHFESLLRLVSDNQYDSLRGHLAFALAKTKHPGAAQAIAELLDNGDEESKMCALEALGNLRAKDFTAKIKSFETYESADKEWSRAIAKAASKALKKL